ncbi:hypothetical protein MMC11_002328 [Xylographa trunciseda]|nr:hypothetical protein [Xylographa trunciseda]
MALEQYINALRIRHRLRSGHCNLTQAFYIVSGGLRIQRQGQVAKTVNPFRASWGWGYQLAEFLPETEDLHDKSKSNGIAKGLAIVQISWLVAQCLARAHHGLPISELELGTIAFVACTTLSYAFWWHKPMDIRTVTTITDEQLYQSSRTPEYMRYLRNESDDDVDAQDALVVASTIQHLLWTQQDPFGLSRAPNLNFSFRRGVTANPYARLESSSVFRPKLPHNSPGLASSFALFFAALIGAGFGAIHTAAWYFSFPTKVELFTWRIASLLTTLTPPLFSGLLYLVYIASTWKSYNPNGTGLCGRLLGALIFSFWNDEPEVFSVERALRNPDSPYSWTVPARIVHRLAKHLPTWTLTRLPRSLMLLLMFLYAAARVTLILQMFVCFRSMPAEIYVTVEWLQYVPHI